MKNLKIIIVQCKTKKEYENQIEKNFNRNI